MDSSWLPPVDQPLPPQEVLADWCAAHPPSSQRQYRCSIMQWVRSTQLSEDDALRVLLASTDPQAIEGEYARYLDASGVCYTTTETRICQLRSFMRYIQAAVDWGYLVRGEGGLYLDPCRHDHDCPPWYSMYALDEPRQRLLVALVCEGYSAKEIATLRHRHHLSMPPPYLRVGDTLHPIPQQLSELIELCRTTSGSTLADLLVQRRRGAGSIPYDPRSLSTDLWRIGASYGVRIPGGPHAARTLRHIHDCYARRLPTGYTTTSPPYR